MKVKELIEILSKYPGGTEIHILEKVRTCGAGYLANIVDIHEGFDQDTNIPVLHIETDYMPHHLRDYEREEEYPCQENERNK
jgi:hypothetical protein